VYLSKEKKKNSFLYLSVCAQNAGTTHTAVRQRNAVRQYNIIIIICVCYNIIPLLVLIKIISPPPRWSRQTVLHTRPHVSHSRGADGMTTIARDENLTARRYVVHKYYYIYYAIITCLSIPIIFLHSCWIIFLLLLLFFFTRVAVAQKPASILVIPLPLWQQLRTTTPPPQIDRNGFTESLVTLWR